jgi:hypothetical protein
MFAPLMAMVRSVVFVRGNHREDLFATREDRLVLNEIVTESTARYEARVLRYIHLNPVSAGMVGHAEVKESAALCCVGRACATSV